MYSRIHWRSSSGSPTLPAWRTNDCASLYRHGSGGARIGRRTAHGRVGPSVRIGPIRIHKFLDDTVWRTARSASAFRDDSDLLMGPPRDIFKFPRSHFFVYDGVGFFVADKLPLPSKEDWIGSVYEID